MPIAHFGNDETTDFNNARVSDHVHFGFNVALNLGKITWLLRLTRLDTALEHFQSGHGCHRSVFWPR